MRVRTVCDAMPRTETECIAEAICMTLAKLGFREEALDAARELIEDGDQRELESAVIVVDHDFPGGVAMDDDPNLIRAPVAADGTIAIERRLQLVIDDPEAMAELIDAGCAVWHTLYDFVERLEEQVMASAN